MAGHQQQQPSLEQQMQALQKRVDRRDKQRRGDRERGGSNNAYDAPPQAKRHAPNATGGLPLGSAAASIAAAALLGGPTLHRCELCDATLGSEREMAQHLEGAAHRKAQERAEAEAERRRRLGAYADVAASAVEAAAWQSGGALGRSGPPPRPNAGSATGGNTASLGGGGRDGGGGGGGGRGGGQQQHGGGRGRGRGPPPGAPKAPHARELTSHAEMLRQARGQERGPLSIDGWVPPTVALQPAAAAAAAAQQPEEEDEQGGLGGLLGYSDDGEEGQEAAAAAAAVGAGQQQEEEEEAHAAASSSSGSGSDDSESEDGGGGGAPAAFFTF